MSNILQALIIVFAAFAAASLGLALFWDDFND